MGFSSSVYKEIKKQKRADLAFCKSLREVCKSPKPNIDEIECLLQDQAQCTQLDNFRSRQGLQGSQQRPLKSQKAGHKNNTIQSCTVEASLAGKVFTGNGHGLFTVGDSRWLSVLRPPTTHIATLGQPTPPQRALQRTISSQWIALIITSSRHSRLFSLQIASIVDRASSKPLQGASVACEEC